MTVDDIDIIRTSKSLNWFVHRPIHWNCWSEIPGT
jgi:hypothetical protein